jgi:hypothetical protein
MNSDGEFTYSLVSLSSLASALLWFMPPLATIIYTYYLFLTETDYLKEAIVNLVKKRSDQNLKNQMCYKFISQSQISVYEYKH